MIDFAEEERERIQDEYKEELGEVIYIENLLIVNTTNQLKDSKRSLRD
ncbi:hypothetical protein J6TS1_15970 [Siminovitchia terrae]|uniref:Uncharacterized protein n=1 Tax=Siminovitchia terrae TaxID=1914933 RepID=A0ABQ4KVK4_SIMTE|nr:hypothetical protein J6TS1_15970 [Siminovitchia terrae]